MSEFDLHPPHGSNKKKRIVGRGSSSGLGSTAGRGNKGQQSRSGGKVYIGFEGGQMPLYRRVARRGFSNTVFRKDYTVFNLSSLEERYADGETVNRESLIAKGLLKKKKALIKVLADGDLSKKLTVDVDKVSVSAKEKIKRAGGTVVQPAK